MLTFITYTYTSLQKTLFDWIKVNWKFKNIFRMVIWDWFSPLDHIPHSLRVLSKRSCIFPSFPRRLHLQHFLPNSFCFSWEYQASRALSCFQMSQNSELRHQRFHYCSFHSGLPLLSLSLLIVLGLSVRWICLLAKLSFVQHTRYPSSAVPWCLNSVLDLVPVFLRFLNCGSQVQYLKSSVYHRLATCLLTEVFCLCSAKLQTPALKRILSVLITVKQTKHYTGSSWGFPLNFFG